MDSFSKNSVCWLKASPLFKSSNEAPKFPQTQVIAYLLHYHAISGNTEALNQAQLSLDKMIGGVCSGIANYLGTDPAIVRILFAIISFGGFG